MPASARKLLVAMAIIGVGIAPMAACSSSSDSSSRPSSGEPLLQIPDANGQYSAEQDQQWLEVTGKDPSVPIDMGGPKQVINASSPESFEAPGDIAPGTYVFKPHSGEGYFYMSAGYQQLPDIQSIAERTLVTVPEGTLVLERIEVFEPTAEQLSRLARIELSAE